jgi:hypothetical protein
MEEAMGVLYKNIDDLKILKDLFPNATITAAEDTDIYGDGKQAGTAYYIYDDTYLLVPVKSTREVKTITGNHTQECIKWDVHVSFVVPSCNRMQPDDVEEKELLLDTDFCEAVAAIGSDMFRCEIMNCLENWDYTVMQAEEEMEPYA